ncbi:hypothetical protein BT69DRAFT_1291695 [Atractiella rhizophila]|nr:hypothetical protein BT69DRAFT_1291695 [Atractiella rhizophila]
MPISACTACRKSDSECFKGYQRTVCERCLSLKVPCVFVHQVRKAQGGRKSHEKSLTGRRWKITELPSQNTGYTSFRHLQADVVSVARMAKRKREIEDKEEGDDHVLNYSFAAIDGLLGDAQRRFFVSSHLLQMQDNIQYELQYVKKLHDLQSAR